MIRLKKLLTQIAEKRAARMAEADAETAAKFAGMQNRDDVELATVREPADADTPPNATPLQWAQGKRQGIEVPGPTVQKTIEKDKRSGQQSDIGPLKTAHDARQKRLKGREVFGGVRGNIGDLPPDMQKLAKAKQDMYNKDMASAQQEFDDWDKEREDEKEKEQAQKAAAKAAAIKQKSDKYMNAPNVGNIELPTTGDSEADSPQVDQDRLDTAKARYQDYLRYNPSDADATEFLRMLMRRYKLPSTTNLTTSESVENEDVI